MKKMIALSIFIILIILGVAIFLPNYPLGNGLEYKLMPSITCEGNTYWYMIEYAVYHDNTLAFLLIQKAKRGNSITGQANIIGRVTISGKVTNQTQFLLNGIIPLPNKEFIIYENLCTGLHSAEIVNKSNEKISLSVMTNFFNEEHRSSYDLSELLKYNMDFSQKSIVGSDPAR